MPLPSPRADEEQEAFISRCLRDPATQDITGDNAEQAHQRQVAACFRQWSDAKKSADGHEIKAMHRFEIKDAEKGQVEAVFATLNVKDFDGDYTLPGAFDTGAEVVLGAYGHSSYLRGQLPVGIAKIRETGSDVRIDGQFNLDTQAGREHFSMAKMLGPLQEWSYEYDVLETGEVTQELRQMGVDRVIKKAKVYGVSPVQVGAGVNTHTVATKAAETKTEDPPKAPPQDPEQEKAREAERRVIDEELKRFARVSKLYG